MKKRIISLILVVAMAFLTLTGCAYNYAKDDMSKYATIDRQAFYDALHALVIEDGTFGTVDEGENGRDAKVQDAIAEAILKVTDTTEKVFAGNVEKYDALYFCYYATDAEGNVFYASKMDETKPTNIQVGLLSLEGLNKAISAGIPAEDIANYIYSTSSANVVGKGDVISLSYTKTWKEGEETKTETKSNTYFTVGENNALAEALIGKQVGVAYNGIEITEGEIVCTYNDVKVESIVKDNSTIKVADGDVAYLTYTITFDAKEWFNEETKKYELPEGYDAANVDNDGKYKATVSYEKNTIVADPADATAETKTLLGQLVDKTVGSTTSSITVKNVQIGDKTIEVKYTNVKVNWIVNSTTEGFTVNYTPYDEELKEDNTNKKTETNVYGEKITLNKVELTYHIFPIYYLDVENVNAELIIREFYSTVASTQTKEHDHTEDDHEHETEYVFDTLNDTEFKNGDKTLADLVKELVTLYSTLTTKEKTLTDALKSLNTAQSNLAKDTKTSDSETASLNTKLTNAETAYLTAKKEADEAQTKVDEMITKILACKKGETTINEGIVKDYTDYQYDTLETAYKSDIKNKLAKEIITYLNKNVTFKNELPKKAVKDAYNAIMNTYKNDFYEGNYTSSSSSSSSSTSTSTETNYKHYKGNFNDYLIDKLAKNGTMKDVKAKIQEEAEKTVKDIIIIYVFVDVVEEKWETDVTLTKAEKKEIKKNLENTALLYQQYGLSFSYNVEDSYNAEQFDKAMNYLLEEKENEETHEVKYSHVDYGFPKTEDK